MEDVLVVVDGSSTIPRGGDDTCRSTRQQSFEDLDTNTAFANTGEKGCFLGEGHTRSRDLSENIEIYSCQLDPWILLLADSQMLVSFCEYAQLVPVFPLQMQEWQVRRLNLGPVLYVGPQEL